MIVAILHAPTTTIDDNDGAQVGTVTGRVKQIDRRALEEQ